MDGIVNSDVLKGVVFNGNIKELQIGLRVRNWVRVRLSNFKPVTFPEPSFYMLVLGRESSSWDELGMCCDNVKPENWNWKIVLLLNFVLVVQSKARYSAGLHTTNIMPPFWNAATTFCTLFLYNVCVCLKLASSSSSWRRDFSALSSCNDF